MFTIGTAGHVDHGKSTLIRALTGIDPDRLREEKERGMTIDLGFAWLRLPSGKEISIVDVPGHERFIKNMLAGVGGIDLALLVVAADEGVMPQTEEHLAILDLLRVKRGLVAVTKRDLVDDEWLDMVVADIEDHLKGTALEGAPVVTVSATTGDGLASLVAALEQSLADTPPKVDIGRPRLPIDRVFTLSGFGTVVTGTLVDGRLQAGQEVEVQPSGLRSRIRGLQTHKHKVDVAVPGSRVAANLASLSTTDLRRGDVVTTPKWLSPTQRLDVHVKLLHNVPRPLQHGARVNLHIGSAETVATVNLLDAPELVPGHSTWAQLRLADPIAAVKGDLFVLRTPNATIGGGEVVDAQARRHKRFQQSVIEGLKVFQRGSPEDVLLQAMEGRLPCELSTLVQLTGLTPDQVKAALNILLSSGQVIRLNDNLTSISGWARLSGQIADMLRVYHRQHPMRIGIAREELKSKLSLSARVFNEVIDLLTDEQKIAEQQSSLRLPDHSVQFSPEQQEKIQAMFKALEESPFSPPSVAELEQRLGLEPEVMNALLEQKRLVRVTESLVFVPWAYDEMVQKIVDNIKAKGKVTVGEVRDMFGSSRKYVLALLEYLDEQRITRRIGDERVLR